jgi:polyphenol oxidase
VPLPPGVRRVTEHRTPGAVPLWVHPEWEARHPWLAQGTTGRGDDGDPFDLALSGARPAGPALDRWRSLLGALGMRTVAHARQVHGAELWHHRTAPAPGVLVMDGLDGHHTGAAGLLLAVGIADCVPVSLVEPEARVVAIVHAGWRGTAAGIVERGVAALGAAERLEAHCGPAICGPCYEVGPEVHAAVHPDREPPAGRATIDVRAAIAARLVAAGVPPTRITLSTHCTRCGAGGFFSHRGGDEGRQAGVLGLRTR